MERPPRIDGEDVRPFADRFPEPIRRLASLSPDASAFRERLREFLRTGSGLDRRAASRIDLLAEYDGRCVYELSRREECRIETVSLLWRGLTGRLQPGEVSDDFGTDLLHLFERLFRPGEQQPSPERVARWMERWQDGLQHGVMRARERNRDRMVRLLVRRIEKRTSGRYRFEAGASEQEKIRLVAAWWNQPRFQLEMAARSPHELNRLLADSLPEQTMRLLRRAREKGMPFFATPYYLSLLDAEGGRFDDHSLRSYILYSESLVEAFGSIRAWEREDAVRPGEPNAAGWLLPDGGNIHRRYPDVAILIPDSMGRACGGLCASCQRMYDFQSRRLNFDFERLKPHESWERRLRALMEYFERDTRLRDILITGGDALMSQNKTLARILEAVYRMALRKRRDNLSRRDGEKYAELQRVRLGTRLPVYLPMRIDRELVDILRSFRQRALTAGVSQFVIQTHFQSPLEVTPEARDAIRMLLGAGWTITNQTVFNAAASRRGHTAQLRRVLGSLGVLCYYTFAVKGFEENREVFAPNSRLVQELLEEKALGRLDADAARELDARLDGECDKGAVIEGFCRERGVPFVATDRSVLNLPGIGKSLTFQTVGIDRKGCRLLRFEHDASRTHSPAIGGMGEVYILENRSVASYLAQLARMGEAPDDYAGVWDCTEGSTERRFPLFDYPDFDFHPTERYSHI